jgi:hypothetical protein
MKTLVLTMLCAISVTLAPVATTVALAQTTGEPVTASGRPSLEGQPYQKTHKRKHRNFYGKHYNMNQHSKGSH